jgi:peptide/nickel transport system ATP-binding protein
MTTPLVELRHFGVHYAGAVYAALADVDLDILRGERLAIVGESGSGKSTLALALAGLLPAGAAVGGTIGWSGLDHLPVAGKDIGFVFQDPGNSLNPVLRVGEQIAEVAHRHNGVGWREAYAKALDLVHRVRLPEPKAILRAFPHQLSGGQRQRVAIAAAMAGNPALLIADEATSALDTIVQAEIVGLLDELVREERMTLLFITHDIALAAQFADRIAVFRTGRLVETGPARATLQGPATTYTAELLASHIDLSRPPLITRGAA